MKKNRVLWASQVSPPSDTNFLHPGWEHKLALAYRLFSKTNKSKRTEADGELIEACRWLIEALYQSTICLPPAPLAIPKDSNAYSKDRVFAPPFGYRLTIDLIDAAIGLGFVKQDLGRWDPNGLGIVSRYTPVNRLRDHFMQLGHCWQRVNPPYPEKTIIISESPKGKDRKLLSDDEHPAIKKMRSNLF